MKKERIIKCPVRNAPAVSYHPRLAFELSLGFAFRRAVWSLSRLSSSLFGRSLCLNLSLCFAYGPVSLLFRLLHLPLGCHFACTAPLSLSPFVGLLLSLIGSLLPFFIAFSATTSLLELSILALDVFFLSLFVPHSAFRFGVPSNCVFLSFNFDSCSASFFLSRLSLSLLFSLS